MAFLMRLVDDLTGEPDATTVEFTFDGVDYEIDLTKQHHAKLRAAFAPYITVVRRRDYRTTQLPASNQHTAAQQPDPHPWGVGHRLRATRR
ncbi:histone-like nucleoid-structuring protein Lsr2 [Curtobacterium sp. MCLR17_054]|uniref:Lsr2 dimerization domain-containing protein n=1 Tax=Curtobacterium sp. MCLR17_054 TaxID=2175632 RepID=UPI000DA8D328|nr:histone-like nucleoid-structuring protein Lsr2 [Curtobacterium sp. MCLR17_054]WIE70297.1 Lsr2 family protein [Curtobacterium sp. MCLR17_054]